MTHDQNADELLTYARRLRILDSAIDTTRDQLDEAATDLVRIRRGVSVPASLTGRLAALALRLDQLEAERVEVEAALDDLSPTVPDRV